MNKNFYSELLGSTATLSHILKMDEDSIAQLLRGELAIESGTLPSSEPYVLIPVEGLHLMCDFVIDRSALFGNEPNHEPSRVGLHDAFAYPYHYLSQLSFQDYLRPTLSYSCQIDAETKQALHRAPTKSLKDYTCLMFELEDYDLDLLLPETPQGNSALLERVLSQADQILDVLRLCLFHPGEQRSIGRAGDIGNGISGIWVGQEAYHRVIARPTSSHALTQPPIDVSLNDVRHVYNNRIYQHLRYYGPDPFSTLKPTLQKVFRALKDFRNSRELQCQDARLRHLFAIVESLVETTPEQDVQEEQLQQSIAAAAANSWGGYFIGLRRDENVIDIIHDLWGNVRHPIMHQLSTSADLGRNSQRDLCQLENLIIFLVRSIVTQWYINATIEESDF